MLVFLKKVLSRIALVGPGLFCLGITVGTGSVTSMVTSGSEYGTQLLWVLALSAFFSWVMTYSYGRYAIASGDTSIHGIRSYISGGKAWAIILIIGLVVSQWISLSSIVNITSNAVAEVVHLFIPSLTGTAIHWIVIGMAVLISGGVWYILNIGNYGMFEKILSVLVTMMGLAFIISMFMELPEPKTILEGLIPSLPPEKSSRLFVAAFVGTTMAAPAFILRPLMLKSKGWSKDDFKKQRLDSIVSSSLSFIVSGAIMIGAAGVLYTSGLKVEKVLDMISILEPLSGRFAVALFVIGLMCAGLSSIFPLMMLPPVLLGDLQHGEMESGTTRFKLLTGLSALLGLVIPVLGFNPIIAQITSQVTQVFVLPLVIVLMLFMINKKRVMGDHKAGWALNIGLILALIFSLIVSYTAVVALTLVSE